MSTDDKIDAYDLEMVTEKRDTAVPSDFGPPPGPAGQAPPDPPPVRVAAVGVGDQVKTHFGRVFGDELTEHMLADEERWFTVATPAVADGTFKRFLLLRRSSLFVGGIGLAVSALFLLAVLLVNMGELTGSLVAGMLVVVGAVGALSFVSFKAAADWALWRRQKKNLSLAMMTYSGAAFAACLLASGSGIGMSAYALALLPLLVSLGPAASRSAIDTKILFPASPVGGWLLSIAAAAQVLLVAASLTLFYVVGSGVLALLVLLALMFAPMAALRAAPLLRRPCTAEKVSGIVDTPQLVMLAAHGIAALFTVVLVLSGGGAKGLLAAIGLLALVSGLYFVARISLLDAIVGFMSEAAAVSESEALSSARAAAKNDWDSFDREVTRDHERERGIYG